MSPARTRPLLAPLLAIVSLTFSIYGFFIAPPLTLTRDSGAQQWETRMKALKQALPPGVMVVGYVSDLDLLSNPTQEDFFTEQDEYPLTAYSLAPRMVQRGLEQEWVIGNFTNPAFRDYLDARLPAGYDLQEVGFGIYLIRVRRP
ncbi:MAG: hypothetical protein DDG60_00245 [Anaerolineae bacterium]|nr:MAG: hypothetical protein DDG60_00245 [Anaerolineae bacterium]